MRRGYCTDSFNRFYSIFLIMVGMGVARRFLHRIGGGGGEYDRKKGIPVEMGCINGQQNTLF